MDLDEIQEWRNHHRQTAEHVTLFHKTITDYGVPDHLVDLLTVEFLRWHLANANTNMMLDALLGARDEAEED